MVATVYPYVLLFCISLGLSFYASRDEIEYQPDQERWLDYRMSDLSKIIYEDEERELIVSLSDKDVFWASGHVYQKKEVEVKEKEESVDQELDSAHNHDHDHDHDHDGRESSSEDSEEKKSSETKSSDTNEPMEKKPYEYLLKPEVKEFIESWAKLVIFKNLGDVSLLNLKDFGLDDAKKSLKIMTKEKTHSFLIGDQSFQSPYVFALDEDKGQVVLLKNSQVKKFTEFSFHYISRNLQIFEEKSNRLKISNSKKTLEFSKSKRLKKLAGSQESQEDYKSIWVKQGDEANDAAKIWVDKLLNIYVQLYEDDENVKNYLSGEPVLSLEVFNDEDAVVRYDFFKVPKDNSFEVWVDSKSLKVPARVPFSKFQTLEDDFNNLL